MSDVTRRMAKRPPVSEGECDICGEPAIEGHTHILKAADCGTEHDIKLTYGGPVSEAQVKATPSKAAMELAEAIGFGGWTILDGVEDDDREKERMGQIIQLALAELLKKAQTLRCAFGGYAPTHGCACNNCDLANALEPWKPK